MTFTFFGVDAYATLTLESWRGLSAVAAGVVLTAATISWTAGSWIQARYAGRWSSARFVRAGLIVTVIGLIAFSTILAAVRAGRPGRARPSRWPASGWASATRRSR